MNSPSRLGLAAVAIVVAAACSDTTAPPKPGIVTVSFVTPHTDDGAISLDLTGPGVSSVQPGSSAYAVFWRIVSASEARLIVVGDLSAGVVATVAVGDVNRLDAYHAEVIEVATRSDSARISTAGYALTLAAAH